MTKKLGRIKRIKNLREIWSKEASDFTRWLAEEENLKLLSDTIGVDLELIRTEANVGRYNVDILAKDLNTNSNVVIENQIEDTNHDHLGKLITYAAGHDVSLAIWIVRKAKEEHAKAVEWLNAHSDDNVGFFLLEIQVLQIGDSIPAPQFNIVVKPNEWAKAIKADNESKELTDTKQQQLKFWTEFKEYIEAQKTSFSCQTPRPQHWYTFSIGSSIAHVSAIVNSQKELLACELYIPKNKPFFNFLKTHKDEIEKSLGECNWVDASVASRVLVSLNLDEVMSEDNEKRANEFKWLLSKLQLMKKVFTPLLKEFSKQK